MRIKVLPHWKETNIKSSNPAYPGGNMKFKLSSRVWFVIFVVVLLLQACGTTQPTIEVTPTAAAVSTGTPELSKPTVTVTPFLSFTPGQFSMPMPTQTPNVAWTQRAEARKTSQAEQPLKATQTPRSTRTPNFAITQQMEAWNAETQAYYEKGYLNTTDGVFIELDDYEVSWARLSSYHWEPLVHAASDFFMSAHFKWSSAYRSADISGCGFVFATQPNYYQYAVFLDRSKVLFVETEYYYSPIGTTRGTGRVHFDNPFDKPAEADFTLIVRDAYAYVLVNGEVVGEYTLSQSKILRGRLGLAVLSGTNKDFGTRCEMTDLHAWIPKE
jgi:hypothetical protein